MFNINSKTKVPLADAVAEIGREIQMRASVYPKLIEQGKLSADKAQRQYDAMLQVQTTLMYVLREAEKIKAGALLLKACKANPKALTAVLDDPLIKQLAEQFPGLELVAIRDAA